MMIESDDEDVLQSFLDHLLQQWQQLSQTNDEPMLNALCSYQQRLWRVLLFPRKKHRPSLFYADEEHQLLISPGAIDMGGVLIVPRRKEFEQLNETTITTLYSEVSESVHFTENLIERIKP